VPVAAAFAVVVVADSHRRPLPLLLLLLAAAVAGEGHEFGCRGSSDVEEEEPRAGGESRRQGGWHWIRGRTMNRGGGGGGLDPRAVNRGEGRWIRVRAGGESRGVSGIRGVDVEAGAVYVVLLIVSRDYHSCRLNYQLV
jgi:hypothetical protein